MHFLRQKQIELNMKKVWFFVPLWAIFCLFFIGGCAKTKSKTVELSVSFFVTDQEGLPVSGAEISFKALGLTFITDDGGRTENVSLSVNADDCADGWYGTTVVVRAENKVTIAIFNFVLYPAVGREVDLMMLTDDGTLPYCAYVEIPSADAIRRLTLQ